jgi:hypothetical protein
MTIQIKKQVVQARPRQLTIAWITDDDGSLIPSAPYERQLISEVDGQTWHQIVSHDVKFSKWLIDQPMHQWSRVANLTFLVSDNLYTMIVLKWG